MSNGLDPKTLMYDCLRELMKAIIRGDYRNGMPPQDTLAVRMGFHRSSLREAIAVLRFCDVLEVKRKTGTHVLPRDKWKPVIMEVLQ